MKKSIILMVLATAFAPLGAQPTNSLPPLPEKEHELRIDRKEMHRSKRRNRSPESKEKRKERRLKLMEQSLDQIGLDQKERERVMELQKQHRKKMRASMERINAARDQLTLLQNEGAGEEAIDKAIDAVSAAQTEQLRILVRNRMEMERILGREKYAQFMERARMQYRKHGRRGGAGVPPRPDLPPMFGPGSETPDLPSVDK